MPRIGGNSRNPFQQPPPQAAPLLMDRFDEQLPPLPERDLTVDLAEPEPDLPDEFELTADGDVAPVTERPAPVESPAHRANLALLLDEQFLIKLGQELVDLVEQDIKERAPWRERFERGMEMMGLIDSDIDDGAFPGASTAVPPLLVEAVTQFWARAMAELFPAEGPAKAKVYGQQTEDKLQRAQRVAEYLNYECTQLDEGYMAESSRLLWNVPVQGCAFRKTFRDPVLDRTVGIFVPAEDMIVPAEATDLKTAPRFTHHMRKTRNELKRLQLVGFYRNIDLGPPAQEEEDEIKQIKDESVDVEPDQEETDDRYEVFEICIDYNLPGFEHRGADGQPTGLELPYLISVERHTRKVLSIYRCWDESDPLCRRKVYVEKYSFVPGPGFYDYGLLHLIGGLQKAATGALRVLLDSAATASLSGGFVAKNANLGGATELLIEPGKWKSVKASAEDLQKAFFTPPFREPAPALFQLLGFLMQASQRFTATTELQVGETNRNMPVGTTLALIEQGQKVMSTIHRMLHGAVGRELRVRYELAREHAPQDGYPYDVAGEERTVYAQDFGQGVDIIPVSDPNIFSSAQRLAIGQAVYEVAAANPMIVKLRSAIKRLFAAMRVPDLDDLIQEEPEAQPYDPNGEVQALLTGKPILVLPEQPHLQHLQTLAAFAQNPGYGGNKQVLEQIGPALASVIGQHMAYAWTTAVREQGVPVGYIDPKSGQVQQPAAPPEVIAQLVAEMAPMLASIPGLPGVETPTDGAAAVEEEKVRQLQRRHEQEIKQREEAHQQKLRHDEEAHGLKTQAQAAQETVRLKGKVDDIILSQEERKGKLLHEQASRQLDRELRAASAQIDAESAATQAAIEESRRRSEAMMSVRERAEALRDKQQTMALGQQDREHVARFKQADRVASLRSKRSPKPNGSDGGQAA